MCSVKFYEAKKLYAGAIHTENNVMWKKTSIILMHINDQIFCHGPYFLTNMLVYF